jgi:hypothetical protein
VVELVSTGEAWAGTTGPGAGVCVAIDGRAGAMVGVVPVSVVELTEQR